MGRSGPSRAKRAAAFRFHAHKVGLTYSCPVNAPDNPIVSATRIVEFMTDKFGPNVHTVGTELHESGKRHYHADIKFDAKLDSEDPRLFDIDGVHPNILKPGAGWTGYCKKHGDVLTNREGNVFAEALRAGSVREGMDIIALQDPGAYLRFGETIERNLRRRLAPERLVRVYLGPFLPVLVDTHWDPNTHSLLIWGPPGVGKTQFARYYMSHRFGEYDYVKKCPEQLKKLQFDKPFIFDEVNLLSAKVDAEVSREITDVENGGSVDCRNSNVDIPPGVPRLFLSNLEYPFRNPADSVYGRRVVSVKWEL